MFVTASGKDLATASKFELELDSANFRHFSLIAGSS